jgi:hypothetical protein
MLNFSLPLTKHEAMKIYEGLEVQFQLLAASWRNGSASSPGRFIFEKWVVGVHFIGGWLGLATGMASLEKSKIFVSAVNRTPILRSSSP